jgi:hypothetical protein
MKLIAPLSSRHLQHLRAANEASASLPPASTDDDYFFPLAHAAQKKPATDRIPRASFPTRAHNRDVSRSLTPLPRSTYWARIFLRPYPASTGDAIRITTKRCTNPNSQLLFSHTAVFLVHTTCRISSNLRLLPDLVIARDPAEACKVSASVRVKLAAFRARPSIFSWSRFTTHFWFAPRKREARTWLRPLPCPCSRSTSSSSSTTPRAHCRSCSGAGRSTRGGGDTS